MLAFRQYCVEHFRRDNWPDVTVLTDALGKDSNSFQWREAHLFLSILFKIRGISKEVTLHKKRALAPVLTTELVTLLPGHV